MFLRGLILFYRKVRVITRKIIFVSNIYIINDLWNFDNVAIIYVTETAMLSYLVYDC
jgi:hypothetical protein